MFLLCGTGRTFGKPLVVLFTAGCVKAPDRTKLLNECHEVKKVVYLLKFPSISFLVGEGSLHHLYHFLD
jgi:hypothetical protein